MISFLTTPIICDRPILPLPLPSDGPTPVPSATISPVPSTPPSPVAGPSTPRAVRIPAYIDEDVAWARYQAFLSSRTEEQLADLRREDEYYASIAEFRGLATGARRVDEHDDDASGEGKGKGKGKEGEKEGEE